MCVCLCVCVCVCMCVCSSIYLFLSICLCVLGLVYLFSCFFFSCSKKKKKNVATSVNITTTIIIMIIMIRVIIVTRIALTLTCFPSSLSFPLHSSLAVLTFPPPLHCLFPSRLVACVFSSSSSLSFHTAVQSVLPPILTFPPSQSLSISPPFLSTATIRCADAVDLRHRDRRRGLLGSPTPSPGRLEDRRTVA